MARLLLVAVVLCGLGDVSAHSPVRRIAAAEQGKCAESIAHLKDETWTYCGSAKCFARRLCCAITGYSADVEVLIFFYLSKKMFR